MASKLALWEVALTLCLGLAGLSPALGYRVATAAEAVPSPLLAGTKFPDITQVIASLKNISPDLAAYFNDPKTVCTVFTPTNEAMHNVLTALGPSAGLVLQNTTMIGAILDHQVIPNQTLKAEDMGTKVKSVVTKAGEPLYFVRHGQVPYIAYGREYVEPIEVANIKAGGCIIHIVGQMLMPPPSLQPTFIEYLAKNGNASALQAPPSLWLTDLPQVNGTTTSAAAAGAPTATGASTNSAPSPPAGAGSQTSSAQRSQISRFSVGAAEVNLLSITYAVGAVLALLG